MTTAPLTDVQLVELERCALVEEGSDEDGYPFCDSRSHAVVWDALPQLIAQCKRAITLESELAQLRREKAESEELGTRLRGWLSESPLLMAPAPPTKPRSKPPSTSWRRHDSSLPPLQLDRPGIGAPSRHLPEVRGDDDLARAGYTPSAENGEVQRLCLEAAKRTRELKALRDLETRLRAAPARMPYPLRDDVLALLKAIDEARK